MLQMAIFWSRPPFAGLTWTDPTVSGSSFFVIILYFWMMDILYKRMISGNRVMLGLYNIVHVNVQNVNCTFYIRK